MSVEAWISEKSSVLLRQTQHWFQKKSSNNSNACSEQMIREPLCQAHARSLRVPHVGVWARRRSSRESRSRRSHWPILQARSNWPPRTRTTRFSGSSLLRLIGWRFQLHWTDEAVGAYRERGDGNCRFAERLVCAFPRLFFPIIPISARMGRRLRVRFTQLLDSGRGLPTGTRTGWPLELYIRTITQSILSRLQRANHRRGDTRECVAFPTFQFWFCIEISIYWLM